MRFCEMLLTAI